MVAIEEIQQYQRRGCLEITGMPTLPSDKPKNIVVELGATLGVLLNENDISTAHRLPPPPRKIQDRIIVKFVHYCRDVATRRNL